MKSNEAPASGETVTCMICNKVMPSNDRFTLMFHLLRYHPVEFATSESGLQLIRNIGDMLSNAAEDFSRKLKERAGGKK